MFFLFLFCCLPFVVEVWRPRSLAVWAVAMLHVGFWQSAARVHRFVYFGNMALPLAAPMPHHGFILEYILYYLLLSSILSYPGCLFDHSLHYSRRCHEALRYSGQPVESLATWATVGNPWEAMGNAGNLCNSVQCRGDGCQHILVESAITIVSNTLHMAVIMLSPAPHNRIRYGITIC